MGDTAVLKKLGVLSVAKLEAVVFAVVGLIEGILFAAIGASLGLYDIGGILSIVTMPILFGILGFIAGAVGAFIYNLIAGKIGGIEMEFEEKPRR